MLKPLPFGFEFHDGNLAWQESAIDRCGDPSEAGQSVVRPSVYQTDVILPHQGNSSVVIHTPLRYGKCVSVFWITEFADSPCQVKCPSACTCLCSCPQSPVGFREFVDYPFFELEVDGSVE